MFLKNVLEISIWNKNLGKIFFLSRNMEVAHLKIKKKQVEIAHLSSNILQTFGKDCVNTYAPQLMDFKLLLLRILQWCWQAFWRLFGREHGGHSGTHLSGLWIRYNLRKKKNSQLLAVLQVVHASGTPTSLL